MKKIIKILLLCLSLLILAAFVQASFHTDTIECDNNTLIVSVCTGDMRALETGVSVYAGCNNVPLILSDKTMPEQLNGWLPGYVAENNITRIIVVGPVTPQQLFDFMKLGVQVKQVNGNTIPEILTKLAENSKNLRNDSVILTASDPLAGELGAYMKIPVFITASNSTYSSSENLSEDYLNYMKEHQIKNVIIVGNLPETIKKQLTEKNITFEELSGENSLEVSRSVNNKLVAENYVKNPQTVYYGFYGELPTIIPSVVKNNALLVEDSSNTGNILSYLQENNIETVVVTRNTESDYIQMEETDYISSDVTNQLEKNNITVKWLTKKRTLDEATGLYDMKILTVEDMNINDEEELDDSENQILKTEPPLIAMLNTEKCIDSNNVSAEINENAGEYKVKWSTIHPYTWKKINEKEYCATSNTGYEYHWTKDENTWKVSYTLDNKEYYNTTWIENKDNSWTEVQKNKNFTWKYDGMKWKCYDHNAELIYYISSN
ncbi:MAG: hypothetical protein E7Z85_09555 [Methanosphaera stadtmanae]|nr:hypothetical protein [Methanosphaera stadtmanae]